MSVGMMGGSGGSAGSAVCFVPASRGGVRGWRNPAPSMPRQTALKRGAPPPRMRLSDMIGADVESGGLFDPLGLATDETALYRRRVAELKHGRVAMLAVVGVATQAVVHLPGAAFSNPRPLGALVQVFHECPAVLAAGLALVGTIELTVGQEDYSGGQPGLVANFGQAFRPQGDKEWIAMQVSELKHCRLAMVAITGILAQDLVTSQGPEPFRFLLPGHTS